MIPFLARRITALAARSLPPGERPWGDAMLIELDEAIADGRPLGFALGCLLTAWRRLPRHRAGRSALASHALALGLIIPFAAFHLQCALRGWRFLWTGHDPYYAALMAGGTASRALAQTYRGATPAVAILLSLLGMAHLLIAWAMAERQWRRVAALWLVAAAIAAAVILVILPTGATLIAMAVQGAALAIELVALGLFIPRRRQPHP